MKGILSQRHLSSTGIGAMAPSTDRGISHPSLKWGGGGRHSRKLTFTDESGSSTPRPRIWAHTEPCCTRPQGESAALPSEGDVQGQGTSSSSQPNDRCESSATQSGQGSRHGHRQVHLPPPGLSPMVHVDPLMNWEGAQVKDDPIHSITGDV